MYITDMALTEQKSSDLVSEPSMHFWGIKCESGIHYAQVVGERFRITMAVLDPSSAPKDGDKTVSLNVRRGQYEYLLCVLKHGEIHQVNLNLIFDKGENVIFYVSGPGDVCLSGYAMTDSERDVLNDEIGYLCPLAEVKPSNSKSEKENLSKSPKKVDPESVSPKSKRKAKRENANRSRNGEIRVLEFAADDDSDDSDEDFSANEESSESQESEEYDEEELMEDLEEEIMKLKDDDRAEEEEDDGEAKMKLEIYSGSRKRKLEKRPQPQENSFNDKDSSDSDIVTLPTSDTPIPMKTMKMENSSVQKMSKKKKKKLNESNASENSVTENSPKSTVSAETTPNKIPVTKLEGGIEIQDVIVGKGPIATKGKMVHVFYVGRFKNKKIFDSRLPGKKPFSFKLGAQQVIKGWDIGLQGMKVGGKRKLKVPPSMGYGNSQMGSIPPNSTLFFLVELQAVS